ncbi:MAG: DUF116 domain-containing protein [Planctomycetes bacterium]|nr:DUF116 domain-containing protein [Planctomycetota bacterium]
MPEALDRAVVALANFSTRLRRTRCRPEEVLVLFASCLQRSDCDRRLDEDLTNCARCGRCAVAAFLDLSEKYGVRVYRATGGRRAAARARAPAIKAIVAVACRKELREGVFACLPKAVLARTIAWPCGPCKDTTVEMDRVEEAVRWLLR